MIFGVGRESEMIMNVEERDGEGVYEIEYNSVAGCKRVSWITVEYSRVL